MEKRKENNFEFFVPGQPVGKQRARVVSGHAYTPQKTRNFENQIRYYALMAYGRVNEQLQPYAGDVRISIEAMYKIPKSWPKWKRSLAATNDLRPTTKPDIDNIVKSVLDGMNTDVKRGKNGIYLDDKQVISIRSEKWYGEKPGVWVWVELL